MVEPGGGPGRGPSFRALERKLQFEAVGGVSAVWSPSARPQGRKITDTPASQYDPPGLDALAASLLPPERDQRNDAPSFRGARPIAAPSTRSVSLPRAQMPSSTVAPSLDRVGLDRSQNGDTFSLGPRIRPHGAASAAARAAERAAAIAAAHSGGRGGRVRPVSSPVRSRSIVARGSGRTGVWEQGSEVWTRGSVAGEVARSAAAAAARAMELEREINDAVTSTRASRTSLSSTTAPTSTRVHGDTDQPRHHQPSSSSSPPSSSTSPDLRWRGDRSLAAAVLGTSTSHGPGGNSVVLSHPPRLANDPKDISIPRRREFQQRQSSPKDSIPVHPPHPQNAPQPQHPPHPQSRPQQESKQADLPSSPKIAQTEETKSPEPVEEEKEQQTSILQRVQQLAQELEAHPDRTPAVAAEAVLGRLEQAIAALESRAAQVAERIQENQDARRRAEQTETYWREEATRLRERANN